MATKSGGSPSHQSRGTAQKLRFWVPSALRAPAAPHFYVREMRRLNRLGLSLCVVYLALALISVLAALSADGDPKGHFVPLQLPIALQLAVVELLGLAIYMREWSFPVAYSVFVPVTCILLYASGVAVSHVWGRSRSLAVAFVLTPYVVFLFRTPLRQLYRAIFL